MISLIDFDDCTIPPVTNSISPSSGFPVFQSSSSSVSHVPPSVVSNGGGGDLLGDLTSLDFNVK